MAEETTRHCFSLSWHPLRTFDLEACPSLSIYLNPLSKIKWSLSKLSKIWEVFDETVFFWFSLGKLLCHSSLVQTVCHRNSQKLNFFPWGGEMRKEHLCFRFLHRIMHICFITCEADRFGLCFQMSRWFNKKRIIIHDIFSFSDPARNSFVSSQLVSYKLKETVT